METIVVERTLQEPMDVAALAADGERTLACLQAHNVRFVQTYRSPDGKRVICVYEAPDAESVRIALRQDGALPFDRAWTASVWRAADIAALAGSRPLQDD